MNADEALDLADRVHTRLRAAHQECEPRECALRAMWVEDVLEILEAIRAES